MAVYNPPIEDLPIFDNNVFTSGNEVLTVDVANNNYLKFPIAQGAETLTDITVLGTSTFNGTVNVDNQLIVTGPIVVADVFPAPTQVALLTSSQLTFTDASTTNLISLDDTQILLSSTATPNSIDIKNNVITLTDLSGSNTLTADDWTGNIRTVNTNANLTHYLNFSDQSATGYGHPQKTASISCNPSTGLITATTFSGRSDVTNAITTTNDNTNTAYNLVFCNGVSTTSSLLVDSVTGPLTYNPSSGDLNTATITTTNVNASTLNGEIRYSSGSSPAATFAGTTLTVFLNNVSIRTNTIIFTGGANTVTTLTLNAPRNNGIFYVGIRNNGSAGTSFLTGLAANVLTIYSATVVVPAASSALMSINILTINAIQTAVVGIDLLT